MSISSEQTMYNANVLLKFFYKREKKARAYKMCALEKGLTP